MTVPACRPTTPISCPLVGAITRSVCYVCTSILQLTSTCVRLPLTQIRLLGVERVTREARGNGFRFTVVFRAGSPKAIEVPDAATVTQVRLEKARVMVPR